MLFDRSVANRDVVLPYCDVLRMSGQLVQINEYIYIEQ